MNTRLYAKFSFLEGGFKALFILSSLLFYSSETNAQHSVARQWKDLMLESIRNDFARPTVHARNLFHISIGMYDAWAAYDTDDKPYMLGDSVGGLICPFTGVPNPSDIDSARNEAISFATYRLLKHRFQNSPGAPAVMPLYDTLMVSLGYDTTNTSTNYATGDPAALGNYIAQHIISFGLQDGSNEQNDYSNQYYNSINPALAATLPGNPDIVDPNRWQPLSLDVFIDQSGNLIPFNTPDFLSPEWGAVTPFSLNDSVRSVYTRNGDNYVVYHDPNDPPYLDTINASSLIEEYQWGFSLVSVWSSHLDSSSTVLWDISPASIGNVQSYPTTIPDLRNFYDLTNGGDPGTGHSVNPSTGMPYTPQMVPRADYARVLAEFWADGPDSETPPGHWFELLNYVSDHPSFIKKWKGEGTIIDDLEWDVKAYFTMGGTMHDAAVTAWGIKGWYDYVRPVSAIRYMADQGQSSDTTLANYSKDGIPLVSSYIEIVVASDTLQGFNPSDTGKIKLLAWRGPDYITDPETDVAGVGWILAENWWPYQRPTFITPPFAGYVSGHSTFSRAAAEVMTAMTGDEFFPGGMGEFLAVKDSFLVFEDGPSVDITLQWATYRDASDQCSLSRIWGGIHPPVDDIPGRLIGEKIGVRAFNFADSYMNAKQPVVVSLSASVDSISLSDVGVSTFTLTSVYNKPMDTLISPTLTFPNEDPLNTITLNVSTSGWLTNTIYESVYNVSNASELLTNIDVEINGAFDSTGNPQILFQEVDLFNIDTKFPSIIELSANMDTISLSDVGISTFSLTAVFDEIMDIFEVPSFTFPIENPLNTIMLNMSASGWINDSTFEASYDVNNSSEVQTNIDVLVNGASDRIGNNQSVFQAVDLFNIDMVPPSLVELSASGDTISQNDIGASTFVLSAKFDERMNTNTIPVFSFPTEDPDNTITLNASSSNWMNDSTFQCIFDVTNSSEVINQIDVEVNGASDLANNSQVIYQELNLFSIDTKSPSVFLLSTDIDTISISDVGVSSFIITAQFDEKMDVSKAPTFTFPNENPLNTIGLNVSASNWLNDSTFLAIYDVTNSSELIENIDIEVSDALDRIGNTQLLFQGTDRFTIDTKLPTVFQLSASIDTISLINIGTSSFKLTAVFDEVMDLSIIPVFTFPAENPLNTITLNVSASNWSNDSTFTATYDVNNASEFIKDIDVEVAGASDRIGNAQVLFLKSDLFNIDTKQPSIFNLSANIDTISFNDVGISKFVLTAVFDEMMDTLKSPKFIFPNEDPINTITFNSFTSNWLNDSTFLATYNVNNSSELIENIDVDVNEAFDRIGNAQLLFQTTDLFSIDTKAPNVILSSVNLNTITLNDTGIANLSITLSYDETMKNTSTPTLTFPVEDPLLNTLVPNLDSSKWIDEHTYLSSFDVSKTPETLTNIDVKIENAEDNIGNIQNIITLTNLFNIDTKQPELLTIIPSVDTVSYLDTGTAKFFMVFYFDEIMDTSSTPLITFPKENPLTNTLVLNTPSSLWTSQTSYIAVYDVSSDLDTLNEIDVTIASVSDTAGNNILTNQLIRVFYINKEELPIPIPIGNSEFFGITVYPNPILANGDFSVAFSENIETLTATIADFAGKVIQSNTYEDVQMLDLSLQASAGVYLLILKSEDKEAVIRVVKK